MRQGLAALLGGLLGVSACQAREDVAGHFDYYVLALSWSPEFCASGNHQRESQCTRPLGFVVHGLWPQNERGYPERCGRGEYLSDRLIERMLPLMPSKSLIIHEWQTHGVCSGLDAQSYFRKVEKAAASIRVPLIYRRPAAAQQSDVRRIEHEFIEANPALSSEAIAVQCGGRNLREVRICLTQELTPRACSAEVRDHCPRDTRILPVAE